MRMIVLAILLWAAPVRADRAKRFDVIARVAEIPPKLGFCGVLAIRAIIRFEVGGTQAQARALSVGWLSPETLRVGQLYRLTLEPLGKQHQSLGKFPAGPRFR